MLYDMPCSYTFPLSFITKYPLPSTDCLYLRIKPSLITMQLLLYRYFILIDWFQLCHRQLNCRWLFQDKRNFVRPLPASSQFFFDYNVNYPVAHVMLNEDPNLKMMRFELVPKQCVNSSQFPCCSLFFCFFLCFFQDLLTPQKLQS